jgi:uncharacterized protein
MASDRAPASPSTDGPAGAGSPGAGPSGAEVLTAAAIVDLLDLEPLTHEGGAYRRTPGDAHGTAIYFLLDATDASALHRLPGVEVWHHYLGDPVRLLLLHPDGDVEEVLLGPDLRAGQRPQVVVDPGVWMGAVSTGTVSLTGTTMAPPYDQAGFELGDPAALVAAYPQAATTIRLIARRSAAVLAAAGLALPEG